MTRLLRQADALLGEPATPWRSRQRMAKRRARAIEYNRWKDKEHQLYCELIATTRAALQDAAIQLATIAGMADERWRALGQPLSAID